MKLQRFQLDNGLRIVLHEDHRLPLVTVNLWYHVGSKNERPGRTGFAHLFEHMLFQGSQNVGTNDHFHYVQQVGGVANGSTWFDRTNYFETLPAAQLELGLWLESDRMGFLLPAMTEEKLENQRSVVMNERRQRVDNQPYGRAGERLHELLYPEQHPYHWPVIGYMEDIEAATLDDVSEFFRTYYTPNNAVLTLAGALEPDAALAQIRRYFDDIPPGPALEPVAAGAPPPGPARLELLEDDVQLPRLYLAHVVPAYGQPEWYAASLLASVLTDGKASRLHHRLVYERQIAQNASGYVLPTEECATLGLVVTGKPGQDIAAVEAAVLEELELLRERGIGDDELERARAGVLTEFHIGHQQLDHRADLLSRAVTFFDDPAHAAEEPNRYREVTTDDLVRLICALREDQRVRVAVVPKGQASAPAVATSADSEVSSQ